jgi:hypothetical protein
VLSFQWAPRLEGMLELAFGCAPFRDDSKQLESSFFLINKRFLENLNRIVCNSAFHLKNYSSGRSGNNLRGLVYRHFAGWQYSISDEALWSEAP